MHDSRITPTLETGLNTACSHCGKHFKVSDRALGKRAKCKSCGEVFVVRPEAVDDVQLEDADAPPAMGSTTRLRPVVEDPIAPADDPLAALASAADSSIHEHADEVQEHARAHGSYLTRREHGEHSGQAPGTTASMVLGIVSAAMVLISTGTLGVLALMGKAVAAVIAGCSAPALVGGLVALFAIIQGNGARRRIRRSRGVLEGRGKASAGILMGWGALLLLAIAAVVALVILIKHGPVVSTQEKIVN